jgi:glutamate---methylamine ligase
LWDREGEVNPFHDPEGELGLSALAYHFLGGIPRALGTVHADGQ